MIFARRVHKTPLAFQTAKNESIRSSKVINLYSTNSITIIILISSEIILFQHFVLTNFIANYFEFSKIAVRGLVSTEKSRCLRGLGSTRGSDLVQSAALPPWSICSEKICTCERFQSRTMTHIYTNGPPDPQHRDANPRTFIS